MKKNISLFVLVFVFISLVTNDKITPVGLLPNSVFASIYFADIPKDAWYKSDLNDVTQDSRKIIVGFPDGNFKGNNPFTVAQLATCVVKASYFKDLKNQKNTDVWYKAYVNKSKELKYILDGEFKNKDYERAVTRGEMARIIVRTVEHIYGKQTYRDTNKIKSLIKDYNKIPNNLKDYVVKTYDLKIIGGFPNGTFDANKPFTRSQAVVVINRLINPEKRKNDVVDALFKSSSPTPTVSNNKVYKINPDIPQELYQYELKARDWDNSLQTNKWLVEKYGVDKITELMNIGKGYMENFYSVDYHTYETKYIDSLKWYFMPQTTWVADDGVERPIEEHIKYWADMVQKKQITIKSQFITDPSLVYSRGDTVVRGKLIYQVTSCNDIEWLKKYSKLGNVQLGKQYSCIFEVELANMELKDGWKHASEVVWNEVILTDIKEVK